MVREVPDFDFDTAKGGRDKYDWDTLFNGKKWRLDRGVDFYSEGEKGKTVQFVGYVKQQAKAREIEVDVVSSEEDTPEGTVEFVVIQARVDKDTGENL